MLSADQGVTPNDKLWVDDCFSCFLYTGNNSTQTINNGIDLAGKGGMVWIKARNTTFKNTIYDTARIDGKFLVTDTNAAASDESGGSSEFNSANYSGFTIVKNNFSGTSNNNTQPYVSWTFRKSPKFFDVVTYTGNGVFTAGGKVINHSLGCMPGMVIIKSTNTATDWCVWHIKNGISTSAYGLSLNLTSGAFSNTQNATGSVTTTTVDINVVMASAAGNVPNVNGTTYVAYLFAHDTSADGIIQCGSFAGNTTVNLGWEPQFVILKNCTGVDNWYIIDSQRGWPVSGNGSANTLYANSSTSEATADTKGYPTSSGFVTYGFGGSTGIYLAIRRPNKPPTSGTQVYNAIARTGTGAAATVTGVGFAPDLFVTDRRSATGTGARWEDRLRGATQELDSGATAAEAAVAQSVTSFASMDGASIGTDGDWNTNTATYIDWFLKRAPGVFDIVCYTGTGSATTVAHNLGVAPELMIVKARSATQNWGVYHSALTATTYIFLNGTGTSAVASSMWNNTEPTATVFTLGISGTTNGSGTTHVAYLFATKAGISKVGSYTGNGSNQTINCGFTTGARFVLIKRADSTGDWYVWDTTRGIVAGNDSHLSLNSTAAEVTGDDSIDPDASGFIVNQVAATNVNVNTATYIFLAFA